MHAAPAHDPAHRPPAVYRSTHMDRASENRASETRTSENRALLDAIDMVTARLVSEPRVNFQMLAELEELRDEVERDLRSSPVPTPGEVGKTSSATT